MGVLDRFEKGIERAVNGAFAKAFRSEVQPVEIASALRREADDHAKIVARDRTLAPNAFVVELGPADHERLGQWEEALGEELSAVVTDHVRQQRYAVAGPITVAFEEAEDLDTGLFRVRSRSSKGTGAGRRAAGPPSGAPSAVPAGTPSGRRAAVPPPPQGTPLAEDADGYPIGQGADPQQVDLRSHAPRRAAPVARPAVEVAGRRQEIVRPITVIGRGSDSDLVLEDSGASRRHAEIHITGGRARIIDLGSTNGTYVDGSKNPVADLHDGSVITIGRARLVYRAGELGPTPSADPNGPW